MLMSALNMAHSTRLWRALADLQRLTWVLDLRDRLNHFNFQAATLFDNLMHVFILDDIPRLRINLNRTARAVKCPAFEGVHGGLRLHFAIEGLDHMGNRRHPV